MALSHAITAYGLVTKAQQTATSAIAKAKQSPTPKNIMLADTARDRVGEAIDNYNYWITTVPAKDKSKVPAIPEWNPQEYGQLTQQQSDQFGVTAPASAPAPAAPAAPSIPAYVTNPKTDSEYVAAVKYYAQQNGLNIADNDIKTIAYAFNGTPNVSAIVESMRGGDLNESHPFHPKNAAITFANNKQQVVDDAIKNLTLNVVQNQYAVGTGGGASGPADAAVAAENASKQLEEFIGNAVRSGLATPDNVQNIVDKTVNFYQNATEQFAKEREAGLFPKIVSFAANAIVATGTGKLALPQQLAVRAAMSYASGANPSDIVRDVVGTLAAAQIGGDSTVPVVRDFNEAIFSIGSPELQSAIFNGARQGVYATATQQDIAKNMAAGAVAGAIATSVQGKYKDPALSNAVGEFLQAKIAGRNDFEAIAAALSGYATEEEKTNAKKVIANEISGLPLDQVQALGYKTKDEITGAFFPVPPEIAAKQQFKTMPGEVGENIIQVTDKDGIVTYEKKVTAQTPLGNKIDYTILYDTDTNQFYYEYGTGEKKILSKSRPSLRTLDASQEILPSRLVGAQTGQRKQGDDFGVSTVQTPLQVDVYGGQSVEEMPTISLLRTVRTGQKPLQVDVYGGAGFDRGGELAPQESVAQREPEEDERVKQRLITESAQDTPQEEPEVQRPINRPVLLGLLGGGISRITQNQRTPNEREAASMQALSQALSVGDPGDALFGSGLGRRRNVWNVESLRLKDELGG